LLFWRNDDDVAVAINRRQDIAGDLECISGRIANRREGNLLPTVALRQARRVERARRSIKTSKRQPSRRDRLFRAGTRDQSDELVERRAGHLQYLRQAFGRGPAQAAVRRDALAPVES